MKFLRIAILFTIIFSVGFARVFAQNSEYKTASAFTRIATNMLGYNFIAKKIAQGVLKKTLKKTADGEYKVKFDSFSGVDLKKGKFRGLTIQGENISAENCIYITKLNMQTTSDFHYVDYKKDPMIFKTDLPFEYQVEIDENDLNKTFAFGDTFEMLTSLIPLMRVEKPKLTIENQKIRIKSSLKMPFAKPIKFSMSAGLKVENGKIVLTDVVSSGSNDFASKLINIINERNLLNDINLSIFKNTETKASVNTINIKDKRIYIDGNFVIKKTES